MSCWVLGTSAQWEVVYADCSSRGSAGDLTQLVRKGSTAYVYHAGYCEWGGKGAEQIHDLVTLIYHQH